MTRIQELLLTFFVSFLALLIYKISIYMYPANKLIFFTIFLILLFLLTSILVGLFSVVNGIYLFRLKKTWKNLSLRQKTIIVFTLLPLFILLAKFIFIVINESGFPTIGDITFYSLLGIVIVPIILFIFYCWYYLSTFFHELGHYIFALIVGFKPDLVKIGKGKSVLKLKIFNTTFDFRLMGGSGITYVSYSNLKYLKIKMVLFIIGGFFMNILSCLSLFIINLNIYKNLYKTADKGLFIFGISIVSAILCLLIYIELLKLLSSLFPADVIIDDIKLQNDAKQLISAISTNYKSNFLKEIENIKRTVYTRYSNDKIDNDVKFLSNDLRLLHDFKSADYYLNKRSSHKLGVELFLEILKSKKLSVPERSYILDSLAKLPIIKGYKRYLKEADRWSQEVLSISEELTTVKVTRGAILIEFGRYEEGKKILLPLSDSVTESLDAAVICCYLAKAEYFLGNIEQANAGLIKAKNINNTVGNRILKRIQQDIFHGI